MRLSISVAILPLLLPAGTALAAKWVSISDGSARAVYLDSESLQRNGADVRAWTRETFTEEQRSPHTGAMYYSVSSLVRFDCNKRSTVPLTRVLYGSDGTEIRRFSLESVELPVVVTPGSLQEHLLQRACTPNADKKPAPAKVALAETQSKTDVPPGALATAVKGADKPKESIAAAPKPAQTKPPEQKPAEQIKTANPTSKPAVLETPKSITLQPDAARVIERRIIVSNASVLRLQPPKARAAVRTVRAAPKPEKPVHAEEAVHWSYEGKGAPQHWGNLKPEYAACGNGKRQSPIDIQDGAKLELQPIRFEYAPAALRIIDNGHTVQVNYAEGNAITVAGVRYELKQFHFHRPSEELVNGKAYDMVAHLVHKSADGRLAVVAVLFEMGAPNAFIASLWPYLPLEAGHEISLPEVTIDLNTLLPEMRSYYAYMGSLTTPPCTEGVLWLVLKTPVSVARNQVSIFGKLYSMNARPVQPGNGRLIKESL